MANGDFPHKDNYKWPWSVTDREFGALEQELKELRHDFRNLRTLIDLSGISSVTKEDVDDLKEGITDSVHHKKTLTSLEKKCQQFGDELIKLKIKVYTAFSVIGILSAIVVWLIDVAFKAIDKV